MEKDSVIQSGVEVEDEPVTPDMYDRTLMSVRDAWSQYYFSKPFTNERPYTVAAIKSNNTIILDWRDGILHYLANARGELPAELVPISLKVYLDSIDTRRLHERYNLDTEQQIPAVFLEVERMEVEQLAQTISGSEALFIRNDLIKAVSLGLAKEKWDLIYKHNTNPFDCYKLASRHKHLFDGQQVRLPFGLSEDRYRAVMEKLTAVINTPIRVWQ